MIKIFFGGLGATITGHLAWILPLINLAWMLIKDYPLFSWWWVIGDIGLFVLFLAITFWIIITRKI